MRTAADFGLPEGWQVVYNPNSNRHGEIDRIFLGNGGIRFPNASAASRYIDTLTHQKSAPTPPLPFAPSSSSSSSKLQ